MPHAVPGPAVTYTASQMLNERAVREDQFNAKPTWLKAIHPFMRAVPQAEHPTFRYSNTLGIDTRIRVLAIIEAEPDTTGRYTGEWTGHLWAYQKQTAEGNTLIEEILLLEKPHLTLTLGTRLTYETAGLIEWHAWLNHLHISATQP